MSGDPRRWSEVGGGASRVEAGLLDVAREVEPPVGAEEAVWKAVSARVAPAPGPLSVGTGKGAVLWAGAVAVIVLSGALVVRSVGERSVVGQNAREERAPAALSPGRTASAPALQRTASEVSASQRSEIEASASRRSASELPAIEASASQPSAGALAAIEASASERTAGKASASQRSASPLAAAGASASQRTAGEASASQRSAGALAAAGASASERTAGEASASQRSAGEVPATRRTAALAAAGEHTGVEAQATARSTAEAETPPQAEIAGTALRLTPPASSSLAEEHRLLLLARERLRARDSTRALAILEQSRTRFPSAALDQERRALFIEAELQHGDREDALRDASAFFDAYPSSPLTARVKALVR